MAATVLFPVAILLPVVHNRTKRGADVLIWFLLGAAIWSFAQTVQVASTTMAIKLFWYKAVFLGATIAPLAYFLLAALLTGRDGWRTRRRLATLIGVQLLINVAVWTDPLHGLVFPAVETGTSGSLLILSPTFGPVFYLHALFQYLLVVVGVYWLAVEYTTYRRQRNTRLQRQLGVTILAALLPGGANVLFLAGLTPVELTPFAWALTSSLVAVALFRYRLLNIPSLARDTVIENMDSAVFVFGRDDEVVDVSPSGRALLGVDRETVIGEQFETVFAEFPDILDTFEPARHTESHVSIRKNGAERYYKAKLSTITGALGNDIGWTLVFSEITTEVRRKREAERQNERLDNFASIVSHDLRNPLQIASARLELVRDEVDTGSHHIDDIEQAHDRMDTMIETLLAMARAGNIDTSALVEVEQAITQAWAMCPTDGATLEVEFPSGTGLRGDSAALQNVFENLFRNAIEHNDPPVCIRVGLCGDDEPTGFYIEDDGTGITPEQRSNIFEYGYTTNESGNGFGLAIIEEIIDAHGWTIRVTDGTDGGARFEVSNVEFEQG